MEASVFESLQEVSADAFEGIQKRSHTNQKHENVLQNGVWLTHEIPCPSLMIYDGTEKLQLTTINSTFLYRPINHEGSYV